MARIVDFLNKLAEDPAFEAKFDKNKRKTMDDFGLNQKKQDLILKEPIKKLKDEIKKELGNGGAVILIKRG